MRSQSVVPCVGRARAREPHTRVPEGEDPTRDCARIVPLGKGNDRAQSPPSRKKEPVADHATATRTTHTWLLVHRDGNVAPRSLFPATVVDTASDDGVRSDSQICPLICAPTGHRRGPLWRSVRGRWRIRDVQIRLISSRYEVAWKMSKGSYAATSTLEGGRGNGH